MFRNSEASRTAAMAKCLASAPKPGVLPPPKEADGMEVDGGAAGAERGRSRSRSTSGRGAPEASPSPAGSDVDMVADDRPRSVRGPNQYKCASACFVQAVVRVVLAALCKSSNGPMLPVRALAQQRVSTCCGVIVAHLRARHNVGAVCRKQGRLKRGAKALLGTAKGPKKKVVTVRQHGLAKAKRKPRFSKSSKKQ